MQEDMGVMMRRCEKGRVRESQTAAWVVGAVLAIVAAATANGADASRYVPNEILVKFRAPSPDADDSITSPAGSDAELSVSDIPAFREDRFRVRQIRRLVEGKGLRPAGRWQRRPAGSNAPARLDRLYRVRVDTQAGVSTDEVLAAYRSRADVEYAELNPVIAICATPNDPAYSTQWSLKTIQASEAWDVCRGGDEVVVAIIDTGVDYNHRDLQGNLWVNEAELNGQGGVDDDGNGYVDDVRGWNFAYDSNDPDDDQGHGTHCAGIVAAVGNNGFDIAGLCWSVRIMALKILDASGEGNAGDAVPAIYYAVANGADIISGSWGGEESSDTLQEAIEYASEHGVLVVVAAGNEGSDAEYYPASYPEVLAVAATDENDRRWYNSNYGSWVDLAAPGSRIRSLRRGVSSPATGTSLTTVMSGTSMAAPHVSGTCALLLAANPSLTSDELREIVTTTGDAIAEGICSSNGRLNMYEALRGAIPSAGTIHLDRREYADGGRIEILLLDWDLCNAGSQEVYLETEGGDVEVVTLAETEVSHGVFRGEVVLSSGTAAFGDGVLQSADGQILVARYLDADDGLGGADQWREATSLADFSPPMALDVKVQIRGGAVTVSLLTDEPALAEVRYSRTNGGPYDLTATSSQLSDLPSVEIRDLNAGTTYYFVLSLTDEAGNETVADDAGQPYSFTTLGRSRIR